MRFATQVIHAGVESESITGAVTPPIFQTSTYAQAAPGVHKGYDYARVKNPTRTLLENNLAALEKAKFAACFSSGIAAVDATLKLLKPGAKILASRNLYGGTYRIMTQVFTHYKIALQFIDLEKDLSPYLDSSVQMIWLESPSNPLMQIIDLEAVAALKAKHDFLLVIDNTFATPFAQQPLNLGADIVIHSVTKYLAGHSDLLLGAAITNKDMVQKHLAFMQKTCGAIPGPQDCFLALRGIKTLQVRMERHCQNGAAVAQYLKQHPQIKTVYYPGLSDHLNYEVACKQMKNRFGGMLAFTFKDESLERAVQFLKRLKIFTLAESLGGVISLANHPAIMTHASVPKEQREQTGITDSLIRLSVGIEAIEDLLEDLEQALLLS